MSAARELWIFGYGSLVWRPEFPFVERRAAHVVGWERRFYQGSTDHRGVPGAPGRVVTLLPAPRRRCHGVIYRVDEADAEAVLAGLDHREKGGYARHEVDAHLDEAAPPASLRALLYLATPQNPDYLGPAAPAAIAAQILGARGPSGANVEYLLRLAEALRALAADDPHVFELERMVRSRLDERR